MLQNHSRCRRRLPQANLGEFSRQLVEPFENFLVARFIRSGLFRSERNRAARCEHVSFNFSEVSKSLFVSRGFEFLPRQHFLRQPVLQDLSVLNQRARLTLAEPVKLLMAV